MNVTTQSKIVIANIVGILVLALGMFGIDVDPDQQAQIVGGLGAIGCLINTVLIAFRSREQLGVVEIDAAVKRHAGFARPGLLYPIAALSLLLLLALPGCTPPQTQPQVIGQSYITIETVADAVGIAYRDGYITDGQRQDARQQLQAALELTADAQMLGDSDNRLLQAQGILQSIQRLLDQEGYRHGRE